MKRFLTALLALIPAVAGAQTAEGLRTDLVAATDAVYSSGYLSSIALEDVERYRSELQYAKIASEHPSLSWMMGSDMPSTLQTACRVLVASSREALAMDKADVWDSGRIEGASPMVRCAGTLSPSATYFWKVKLWDNHGREGRWSEVKAFRTAEVMDGSFPRTPLVKTDNVAVSLHRHADGTGFLDFGRDAFGQLRITLTSSVQDTLTIHLGEAAVQKHVDRKPGGSIRYCSYPLVVRPGTATYRLQFVPDGRNAAIKPRNGRTARHKPQNGGESH